MRTEYVIPLSRQDLRPDRATRPRTSPRRLGTSTPQEAREGTGHAQKQQAELQEFDEKLRHYADQRISLDLDDGVKVNYGKFGDLLAEVKAVTGGSDEE